VIPWILLDTGRVPGGDDELRLMQRGSEYSIRLGQNELMNSRLGGSEEALATIVCGKLTLHRPPRILIGGLGMGFTLRAALGSIGADASVIVAELVPSVVAWARGPLAPIFGDSLDDPRVCLREADVAELIRSGPSTFDAILLDVDNGPDGLTRESNDSLYGVAGLRAAYAALRPGGLLAVWSAEPDDTFMKSLRAAGFAAEEVKVRARRSRAGAKHVIWVGTRRGSEHPGPAAAA
jgi:spermidine synthase